MVDDPPVFPVRTTRLEQVLRILAEAALGNYGIRISNLEHESDDKFLELEVAVNMMLDELQLVRQRDLEQQEKLLAQAEQLRLQQSELVPGVLALPIIGAVELERAQRMTEAMLERVVQERATHVILDLTGAGDIAAGTAQSLLRMATALGLLGSRCIITGLSPTMARTLVSLQFDSSKIIALPQLADALTLVLHEKALRAKSKLGNGDDGSKEPQ
jgi:rsbT co-antagonist protein RsbR